jgi:uncharacterized protein (DUF305 family)
MRRTIRLNLPAEAALAAVTGGPIASDVAPVQFSAATATQANFRSTMSMHYEIMAGLQHEDADVAFVMRIISHHQVAIDMALIQLRVGSDSANMELAQLISVEQQRDIDAMRTWLQ